MLAYLSHQISKLVLQLLITENALIGTASSTAAPSKATSASDDVHLVIILGGQY